MLQPRRIVDLAIRHELDGAISCTPGCRPRPVWPQWRVASVNRAAAASSSNRSVEDCRTPAGTPAPAAAVGAWRSAAQRRTRHIPSVSELDRLARGRRGGIGCGPPGQPAIVVDFGSASHGRSAVRRTVVFAAGRFFPGIDMAARALNEFTDLLPLVTLSLMSETPARRGRLDCHCDPRRIVLGSDRRGAR